MFQSSSRHIHHWHNVSTARRVVMSYYTPVSRNHCNAGLTRKLNSRNIAYPTDTGRVDDAAVIDSDDEHTITAFGDISMTGDYAPPTASPSTRSLRPKIPRPPRPSQRRRASKKENSHKQQLSFPSIFEGDSEVDVDSDVSFGTLVQTLKSKRDFVPVCNSPRPSAPHGLSILKRSVREENKATNMTSFRHESA